MADEVNFTGVDDCIGAVQRACGSGPHTFQPEFCASNFYSAVKTLYSVWKMKDSD